MTDMIKRRDFGAGGMSVMSFCGPGCSAHRAATTTPRQNPSYEEDRPRASTPHRRIGLFWMGGYDHDGWRSERG
jgi:hypothetical protein